MSSNIPQDGTIATRRDPQVLVTVEKTFDLLELLVEAGGLISLQEVSERLQIPKSTAHRLLATLVKRGYARRNASTRTYSLGLRLFMLQSLSSREQHLVSTARPYLRELADRTGFTAHIAILLEDGVGYLDQTVSRTMTGFQIPNGPTAPLYCCSLGKVLLAYLSPAQLASTLKKLVLTRRTENTITDPEILRSELAATRARGYGLDNEESTLGIRCVGAPIRDSTGQVVAAISATGIAAYLTDARLPEFIEATKEAAERISAAV